jgi:peptide/nickel transport system permease protein
MIGVALVCFLLVHIAPGDPLVSILPPDASAGTAGAAARALRLQPLAARAVRHVAVARAARRPGHVHREQPRRWPARCSRAVGNTLRLAVVATFIGFVLGCLFGFVAGYFRGSWIDKARLDVTRCWA